MNRGIEILRLTLRTFSRAFYEIFVPDLNPMSRKLRKIFKNEADKELYLNTMKAIREDVRKGTPADEAEKTIILSNNEEITLSL